MNIVGPHSHVPAVAYACNGKKGKRYDGESETFVATFTERGEGHSTFQDDNATGVLRLNGGGGLYANLIAHSLRAEGFDASEDGTGRGTPLVPVAFDERNVTSRENRSNPQPGDPMFTLHSSAPSIAFAQNQLGEVRTGAVMGTLNANANASGRNTPMIQGDYGVRRLMPVECEACQGMPRDWTRYGITADGKEVELSDSARYRLIGNSVAIPCVFWIAERIMNVHNG